VPKTHSTLKGSLAIYLPNRNVVLVKVLFAIKKASRYIPCIAVISCSKKNVCLDYIEGRL
jgi:hypothetical protein